MKIKVNGTNGSHFLLRVLETTTWGDERLDFKFELGWASGTIQLVCSKDRLAELESYLAKRQTGDEDSFCFINNDGNLEVNISVLPTGLSRFEVIACPNMVDDDRIEFSLDGMHEV